MYFAYGWPKVLKAIECDHDEEEIVDVSVGGGLLMVVSTSCVQVWTAGRYRVKVGELYRDNGSLAEHGLNLKAIWKPVQGTLLVLTSTNVLHFYEIIPSAKPVVVSLTPDAPDLRHVDIRFRSSTVLPSFESNVTCNGLVADDGTILLGLSNGRLCAVSWRGQPRGEGYLWTERGKEIVGPMYLAEANGIPSTPHASTPASAIFSPQQGLGAHFFALSNGATAGGGGGGGWERGGILQLEYSEHLRLIVVVLLDGRVVLCSTAESGLGMIEELTPEKWVGVVDAVCAGIGTKAQVLAVGSCRGTVELFDLADGANHMRTISLCDWGYSVEDTGPVGCISWTPDNWAFAVGWKRRGLAVWSVSGCRLMCTIRQGSVSNVQQQQGPSVKVRSVGAARLSASTTRRRGGKAWKWAEGGGVEGGRGGLVRAAEPMVCGVGALAWAEYGYQLAAAQRGDPSRVLQFAFAKGCVGKGVSGSPSVWQLMQADDRVLLIKSDEKDELTMQHLVIPHAYMAANWPVLHVAPNDDGSYLAISGRRGLILYNLRTKRWRVFGDISQERQVSCTGILWMGSIVIICNHRESNGGYELSFYPRYHLDESSLLCRQMLVDRPIAMDTWQEYILVATRPFDIRVYHVEVVGELTPLRNPTVTLRLVRELSIMSARKPPISLRFVPNSATCHDWDPHHRPLSFSSSSPSLMLSHYQQQQQHNVHHHRHYHHRHHHDAVFNSDRDDSTSATGITASASGRGGSVGGVLVGMGGGQRDAATEAVLKQPTRCMVLRMDGELSLLDLDRGTERSLVSGVEHFWLTCGRPKEEEALIEEVPWWAYGHRGMQVWYPSSPAHTFSFSSNPSSPELQQLDPELDFDREVYPLGVSASAGVIVGISQRLSLSGCSDMPCFEPTPQAQPILPCLLRHLLQRNALEEAVQLARLSSARPHFSHSLEWLLFTIFDAEMTNAHARKKAAGGRKNHNHNHHLPQQNEQQQALRHEGKQQQQLQGWVAISTGMGGGGEEVVATMAMHGPSMLERAANLIRYFPEFLDVVVSVARKTDSRHWPELFAAAGKSTTLFEECVERKQYRTAMCYILVIEKLEGPSISQQNALRLLHATLCVGLYELAGELVRFLLRSGREYSTSGLDDDEDDNKGRGGENSGSGGPEGLLKSFFTFGFTSAAPKARADVLHATVTHILRDYAVGLMTKRELRQLVAFVKDTQFDFDEFLKAEEGKSAKLDDFPMALRAVSDKLGLDRSLQGRLDGEFLLSHVRAVGLREWTVVLATILEQVPVLLDMFRRDLRLWHAYRRTLKAQPDSQQYEDLLHDLESQLTVTAPSLSRMGIAASGGGSGSGTGSVMAGASTGANSSISGRRGDDTDDDDRYNNVASDGSRRRLLSLPFRA